MTESFYYDEITQSLSNAIVRGDASLKNVPGLIRMVLKEAMWKERIVSMTGEVAKFKSFPAYVKALPPEGLGADIDMLQRLCCNDPETLSLIDQAVQNPNGRPIETFDNVQGSPLAPTGNSSASALRRLRTHRPDLHNRVISGEMSPHKAMIEAGFRKRTVPIPIDDVNATSKALKRLMTSEQIDELISLLLEELRANVSR